MCRLAGTTFSACEHWVGNILLCPSAEQSGVQCSQDALQQAMSTADGYCARCLGYAQAGGEHVIYVGRQPRAGASSVLSYRDQETVSSIAEDRSEITSQQRQEHDEPDEDQATEFEDSDVSETTTIDPSTISQDHQRDEELYEAQTDAALRASLREAQANHNDELEKAVRVSQQNQQYYDDRLLEETLHLSLQDTEREYDLRARHDLERALQQSAREFQHQENSDERLHRAKLESFKSLSEDMSRRHVRGHGASASRGGDGSQTSTARPSRPSRIDQVRDTDNQRLAPSVSETAHVRSPRTAARDHCSQRDVSQPQHPPAQPVPSSSRMRPAMPQNTVHAPQAREFEWTRPPAQYRSPSPTITIGTAEAQRAHEDQQRHALYDRHPNRPRDSPAPSTGVSSSATDHVEREPANDEDQ